MYNKGKEASSSTTDPLLFSSIVIQDLFAFAARSISTASSEKPILQRGDIFPKIDRCLLEIIRHAGSGIPTLWFPSRVASKKVRTNQTRRASSRTQFPKPRLQGSSAAMRSRRAHAKFELPRLLWRMHRQLWKGASWSVRVQDYRVYRVCYRDIILEGVPACHTGPARAGILRTQRRLARRKEG